MTTSNRTAAYTAGPPENSTTTGDANRSSRGRPQLGKRLPEAKRAFDAFIAAYELKYDKAA